MKSLLLKLISGTQIKNGIAHAHQVCVLVVGALQGVLAGDGLSDVRRKQISDALRGIIAVRDFIMRITEIIGAPSQPQISGFAGEWIVEKSVELDRITNGL